MREPNIVTSLHDGDYNVTYDVFAYRPLTAVELRAAVHEFQAQPKVMQRKLPLRNKTIQIVTTIGASGSP